MSRKFALLAAAVAFCGLTSIAQAQSGSGGTEGSSTVTSGASTGGRTAMRARPMRAQRPIPQARREMRQANRVAMRGGRGTDMGGSGNVNSAYMGGGAVYQRGADGSLSPVN